MEKEHMLTFWPKLGLEPVWFIKKGQQEENASAYLCLVLLHDKRLQ